MEISDLNLPVKIANTVNEALVSVGVVLPLSITQFITLILCLLGLWYGISRIRKEGVKDLPGLLVTAAFGLSALAIVYIWVDGLLRPLPGEITGQVDLSDRSGPSRYEGLRVKLINFHGDNVGRESGIVDSRNGFFVITYEPVMGDHPRVIRVSAPECVPYEYPLNLGKLRSKTTISILYKCKGDV